MLVLQWELRLAVVVASPAPCHRIMTARAVLTQSTLMWLVLQVASAALTRSLSIGLSGLVAACAGHGGMRVRQLEVRLRVIKLKRHKLDDIGVAPLVLGMASATLQQGGVR